MARKRCNRKYGGISRRVFLARAGGITLSLGAAGWWLPRRAYGREPYQDGVWLAGDHHVHTKYSPDGQYEILAQASAAAKYGLGWCVITDHGGPRHDKVALQQAYPDLLEARRAHPGLLIFQGLEWNIPDAEHGSVILPPTVDEAQRIAEFERRFDSKNLSQRGTPADTEADAVAGVKYLQSLKPPPIFMVNHPARKGVNSPAEMRAWAEAGPDVTRGFEGAPGHQAAPLLALPRGDYAKKPSGKSWAGYPLESYRTWGGYDWYVTRVGGLWDSLLGEGRPWYITANSDSHRHYKDDTVVDILPYLPMGHVIPTTQKAQRPENPDFWPGEYSKTWVHAANRDAMAVLDAIRFGNMFPVHGDLIDRLELSARWEDGAAPMGGTLRVDRAGTDVTIRLRVREPEGIRTPGRRPGVHHIDLVSGELRGISPDRHSVANESARVVQRFDAAGAKRERGWLAFEHVFKNVRQSIYVRLRGTNRDIDEPEKDHSRVDVWNDLWFYSNPVMVRVG